MKHTLAALGLALCSSAVLAQSGALPAAPPVKDKVTKTLPGTPATPTTPTAPDVPVTVTPNSDGTLGGAVSGGQAGNGGAISGTIDPNNQTGKLAGSGAAGSPDFGKLDLNANGSLTRDELRGDTKLLGNFNKLDTNGDGKVDKNEFAMGTSVDVKNPASGVPGTPATPSKSSTKDKAKDTVKKHNQPGDILPGG